MISSTINNTVSYAIMLGGHSFTRDACNNCSFIFNTSRLTISNLLNVSVVASNAVGSGKHALFPTPGQPHMNLHNKSYNIFIS